MILLDTTVLVYAVGAEHPLREPCRAIIAGIGDGRVLATTTVGVIQEFAHVRARRRDRSDATTLAESFTALLAPLISPDADDLQTGLRLFREVAGIGAFDAVLAATALRRDHLTALVSADHAFSQIPGLTYHDPASGRSWEALG